MGVSYIHAGASYFFWPIVSHHMYLQYDWDNLNCWVIIVL
jgi:hypothetical protein